MRIVKIAAAAVLLMSTSGVGVSFAEQAGTQCSCITAGSGAGQVGRIVAAKGEVLASGATNYEAAKAGTPISIGSEISVGAKSSAQISVGTCALPLMANSVTRINAQADGNICVASVQTSNAEYGVTGLSTGGQPLTENGIVPLVLFGTLGGGAAILALTGGGENAISQ